MADLTELVPVTMADREAASAIYAMQLGMFHSTERILTANGQRDDSPIVQILARHRIAAERSSAAGLTSLDDWLDEEGISAEVTSAVVVRLAQGMSLREDSEAG